MADAVEVFEPDDDESQTAQLREDVAESLARLSTEADSPTSFELSTGPFDRETVDFELTDGHCASPRCRAGWDS